MTLKIVWTPQALKGLEKVLEYLEAEWTHKEIQALEIKIKEFIERIAKYPEIYPSTSQYKHTHKAVIDKNNYIIYRIRPQKKIIELINYRGTKQKPLT
ncbi:type II toxin-antitoxin system RelE/ParE family toxin [Aquimarina macrocephali]|uniref:type II toxin-antitoxin system RelE/ParE family toxin n=1 Tax=Aquimarina macrocephali TaxID=666563 RepID=UPI000464DF19|nr:type II toxin-antitoxin system RelE/ParE family toxin [Aquimarina macrocephali]